jgi:peptidoglycan-N-acetylglucosamine deacetylase
MNPASMAALAVAGGACVYTWGAITPSAQLFGPTVRRTSDPRTIALTFDDGPNPAATPALLDLLDRHEVRATFFLIGRFVRKCPALAADIVSRGHLVANHTETHPNLGLLSPRKIADELSRCREAIATATGRDAAWMRPPFGFRGPQLHRAVRRAGFAGVAMWSLWLWDWYPQPAERIIRRLRRASGGDIVLLHDGDYRALGGDRLHSVQALAHWLPRWKDSGLKFVTLDVAGGSGK